MNVLTFIVSIWSHNCRGTHHSIQYCNICIWVLHRGTCGLLFKWPIQAVSHIC